MELNGQALIITGGASGIGYQAALQLAAKGANLIIADFNVEGAEKVAQEISAKGVKAFAYKVDVSKAAEVEAMVDFAVEKLGTLNGIFNNAGIGLVKPFLEMDPASYHKVIEVDQHSVYYGMYYAAKKMVKLGAKGTFVNTASIYGFQAAVGSFNYNAAKAAVVMMSKSARLHQHTHPGQRCGHEEDARRHASAQATDRSRQGGQCGGLPLHRCRQRHQRQHRAGGRWLPDPQERLST